MILYFLLIILLIYLILVASIKIKLKFWSKQPVFHVYNMFYWMFPPGIINHSLPNKNKYTNFSDIEILTYNQLTEKHLLNFTNIISKHYLNEKEITYSPKINNIKPYFENYQNSCFFGFYKKKGIDSINNNIVSTDDLIGVITSRPLQVYLNNNQFLTYYVDYLCVDKSHRKKGIAPELIQTIEYCHRRHNKKISTSFFKREGSLTLIVPLVIYYTYCFKFNTWNINKSLHASIKLVKITKNNIIYLTSFINQQRSKFKCFINMPVNILIQLIESSNIYVYCLIKSDVVISCYFFRNSCTYYENKKALDCFCCINNTTNIPTFIVGFSLALQKFQSVYSILLMENIGHTTDIIQNIIIKHTPRFVSKTAYYFYNFATRPLKEKDISMLI